ncbi:NACHT domain-containing protein [Dactylosporangium vinaceum]|uniref:NACHT domain-containing protein n=1 Tax=Dactylosporangium vinaceum TaxID=53362 RepID=A0ABV5MQK8_9ACTN|nr:NACHT domain-containing protein [Dactylosporangium vinaceum]UAB96466.1 NACHT domain-containing protein [Dactylosporangium vinaceum]
MGAAVIVLAVLWATWVRFLPRESRNDEATFGQFLLALIGFLMAGAGALKTRPGPAAPIKIADELASAVHAQWKNSAGERRLIVPAPIPLRWRSTIFPIFGGLDTVWPDDPDAAPFPPLPGMPAVTHRTLLSGGRQDLLRLYGGLPTGRLAISGPAGSGKTSAGILLVLDALKHRMDLPESDRARTPVPILLSLSSWDPLAESLERWLITQLRQAYPVVRSEPSRVIEKLCRDGSLSLILDGFDEVPTGTRTNILEALSTQANGRVIILSRPDELAAAAQARFLTGALVIGLEPIAGSDAAAYLQRALNRPAPADWDTLLKNLRSDRDGTAARALSTPLNITLLRDSVEPSDGISGLLTTRATDWPDFERHLIDRFTKVAYQSEMGPTATGDRNNARQALGWIAADMERRGTRDLGWWHLPLAIPLGWQTVIIAMVAFVLFATDWSWAPGIRWEFPVVPALQEAFAFAAIVVLATQWRLTGALQPKPSVIITAAVGMTCGVFYFVSGDVDLVRVVVAALGIAFGSGTPTLLSRSRRPGRAHRRSARFLLLLILAATFLIAVDLNAILAAPFGLGLFLAVAAVRRVTVRSDVSSLGPLDTWRGDAVHAVVTGSIFGCLVGLVVMANWNPFVERSSFGPNPLVGGSVALAYYTLAGLVLTAVAHPSGQTWIAALWLRIRAGTPIRILAFLEDARRRGVLRTVGALYQFRHATLQDRLAAAAGQGPESSPTSTGSNVGGAPR